jgi:hypothetical protein
MRILVLIWFLIAASHALGRPLVSLVFVDAITGEPIPSVQAEFSHNESEDEVIATATADAGGKLTQQLPPPEAKFDSIKVHISHPDYFEAGAYTMTGPSTIVTIQVPLKKKITTTLRLLQPDGTPVANRMFVMSQAFFINGEFFTDKKGEFRFIHPSDDESHSVSVPDQGYSFPAGMISPDSLRVDEKIELRLTGARNKSSWHYPASRFEDKQLAASPRLIGKLRLHDGTPARGWRVAGLIKKGWVMGVINGSIRESESSHSINYHQLNEVAEDGTFSLNPAPHRLIFVSPDGLRLQYPLNPSAWNTKNTTVTLPKLTYANVQLRYDSEKGQPAKNVVAMVTQNPHYYDGWELYGDNSGWPYPERHNYSDQNTPLELEELSSLPVSDNNGNVRIPVNPRGSSQFKWNRNSADAPWHRFVKLDPIKPIIVIRRDQDKPSVETIHYTRASCVFTDSSNNPIPHGEIRWSLVNPSHPAIIQTGGFHVDKTNGIHSLILSRYKNRYDFSYTPASGITEFFTHEFNDQQPPTTTITGQFTPMLPGQLQGTILTRYGKPVTDAELHLYSESTNGRDYTQIRTTTDKEGKFTFTTAPDECGINVSPYGISQLMDVPIATPKNRDLDIRLRPFGSFRLTFADAKQYPLLLNLINDKDKKLNLQRSPDDLKTFTQKYMALGTYKIEANGEILTTQPVTILEDQETFIEQPAHEAMMVTDSPPSTIPIEVTITKNGSPVPGARVKIMEVPNDPDEKIYPGHIFEFTGDTTDNNGIANFAHEPGSKLFVAAIDQDHQIGWQAIAFEKVGSTKFKIELSPFEEAIGTVPDRFPSDVKHSEVTSGQIACILFGIYNLSD